MWDSVEEKRFYNKNKQPHSFFGWLKEQDDIDKVISGQHPNEYGHRLWAKEIERFITSELKTAFQIGFLIFIPFLIIDLVVASVLMSMGMMMLSPMLISLPFKIMLFVLIDGWTLVLGTLTASFAV